MSNISYEYHKLIHLPKRKKKESAPSTLSTLLHLALHGSTGCTSAVEKVSTLSTLLLKSAEEVQKLSTHLIWLYKRLEAGCRSVEV